MLTNVTWIMIIIITVTITGIIITATITVLITMAIIPGIITTRFIILYRYIRIILMPTLPPGIQRSGNRTWPYIHSPVVHLAILKQSHLP